MFTQLCGMSAQSLGAPLDDWSIPPLQPLGYQFDDWSVGRNSQDFAETSTQRNVPSRNLNIQHSDPALLRQIKPGTNADINHNTDTANHEIIFCPKESKANKEAAQITSQILIPCIYKIPDELRARKESAYKPRVVSIGPIHYNNERLNANQLIKSSYGDSLFSRIGGDQDMAMKDCERAMEDCKANVKKCYAEKVELIINKQISLADIMLIDGCFILELLYRSYSIKNKSSNISTDDPVFSRLMRILAIRHDLLLLENQIPFFVLEKLFSLTVERIPGHPDNVSLTQYVLSFFGNSFSFGEDKLRKNSKKTYYHILDLLHKCYLPHHNPWEEEDETEFPESGKNKSRFPTASDLNLAGVKFVAVTREDMFDINFIKPRGLLRWFHRARFEIPTLSIYDGTEPLLRNLIAFEQCCPAVPRYMTSYGSFMDTLINSAEDVKLLEKAGILHNYLGTCEEASDLFNNICKEVVIGRFYFAKTCEAAGNHCRELWPSFLASLRRDYFANPWTGIAVFAAIFIFGFTIVQTIYTVLAYYK